jgi:predicted nucleic acid-binding protein
VTVDLAVAETATRLRYDAGVRSALAFRDVIAEAAGRGRLTIRYADESLQEKAWALMERFSDHPLSFADCAGAVTAREARAAAVLALDADFSILGFALEP